VRATAAPTYATPPPPPQTAALSIQKSVRNITQNGPDGQSAAANPSETVEFTLTVRSTGAGIAYGVTTRDTLPSGLIYQGGSTTVDGLSVPDGITAGGIQVGDMAPGRVVSVRFRATLAAAGFFSPGTTTLTNIAAANATGVSASAFTNVTGSATVPPAPPRPRSWPSSSPPS